MPSLYQNLVDAGQINEVVHTQLSNARSKIRDALDRYPHNAAIPLTLSSAINESRENPPVDIAEVQRALLYSSDYEDNKTLEAALAEAQGIQGQNSISATLDKVIQINRGWKSLLPRRENPEHNLGVRELSKLVGEGSEFRALRTNGIFVPDNFITAGLYAAVLMNGVVYSLGIYHDDPSSLKHALIIGGFAGAAAGFIQQMIQRWTYHSPSLMERASFIDEKIRQLKQTQEIPQLT